MSTFAQNCGFSSLEIWRVEQDEGHFARKKLSGRVLM